MLVSAGVLRHENRQQTRALLTGAIGAALLDKLATGEHEHLLKPKDFPPTVPSTGSPGVTYRRRAVDFRYEMCQSGARSDFYPGYEIRGAGVRAEETDEGGTPLW